MQSEWLIQYFSPFSILLEGLRNVVSKPNWVATSPRDAEDRLDRGRSISRRHQSPVSEARYERPDCGAFIGSSLSNIGMAFDAQISLVIDLSSVILVSEAIACRYAYQRRPRE